MKRITSFEESDLDNFIKKVYDGIFKTVWCASLLHVNTIKSNNSNHFDFVVDNANDTIIKLRDLYPSYNIKRNAFVLLEKEKLIKEAEEFFSQDIY